MTKSVGYPEISAAMLGGDFDAVIEMVAEAVAQQPLAALADPTIQDWLARRYRNIFLTEAADDGHALRAAKVPLPAKLIDRRSSRELLAQRYLKGIGRAEAQVEMPSAAQPTRIRQTLMFVPDMMTGLLPVLAFQSVWPRVAERFGCQILTADVHPARAAEANGADIAAAFDSGQGWDADANHIPPSQAKAAADVVAIGYSKGGVDLLSFIVNNPEYATRIRAFVGWAGAFGGSYIADETYEKVVATPAPAYPLSGQIGKALRQIVPVVQPERIDTRLAEYDVEAAVADLTTGVRTEFLAEHVTDIYNLAVPMFTIEGVTSLLEVPYYQAMGVLQLNNYNKNNDMFLTVDQARLPVPHANVLATFRANHWDLAYDPFPWYTAMGSLNVDHKFARYPAMCALVLLLHEIGLVD